LLPREASGKASVVIGRTRISAVLAFGAGGLAACGLDVVASGTSPDAPDGGRDDAAVDAASVADAAVVDASPLDAGGGDADASPCVPAVSGLLAWWRADGTTAEWSGRHPGASGTQGGATAVAFDAGKVGAAFDLHGSSYLIVPNHPQLQLSAAVTLEAWIFAKTLGGRVIDRHVAFSENGYMIDTFQGRLRLVIGALRLSSADVLPTETWTHVAGTFDGTTARVFVDGVEAASTPWPTPIPPNDLDVRIGADSDGANRFDGRIDEPAIHGRALTAAELSAIVGAGSYGRCP